MALIILSLIAYLIYATTKSTNFPNDEYVINSMNKLFHDADASRILQQSSSMIVMYSFLMSRVVINME